MKGQWERRRGAGLLLAGTPPSAGTLLLQRHRGASGMPRHPVSPLSCPRPPPSPVAGGAPDLAGGPCSVPPLLPTNTSSPHGTPIRCLKTAPDFGGPDAPPLRSPPREAGAGSQDLDSITFFAFSLIEGYISIVMDAETQKR